MVGAVLRERFVKLESLFYDLEKLGSGLEDFKTVSFRLLKAFENTRLKNLDQINNLKQEIAFCESTQRACDIFEGMLINLIESHKNDKIKGLETANRVLNKDGKEIPLDTDVLKTICVCGCLDEEDSSKCTCICHKGEPCGRPNCVFCAALV